MSAGKQGRAVPVARHPGGRPRIERDEKTAETVRRMAQVGLPQKDIAIVAGISQHTLTNIYGPEIERGSAEAKAAIGNRLFRKAVDDGDTTSLIFLAKTRLGMREVSRSEIEISQAQRRLSDLSDEELLEMVDRGHK